MGKLKAWIVCVISISALLIMFFGPVVGLWLKNSLTLSEPVIIAFFIAAGAIFIATMLLVLIRSEPL